MIVNAVLLGRRNQGGETRDELGRREHHRRSAVAPHPLHVQHDLAVGPTLETGLRQGRAT